MPSVIGEVLVNVDGVETPLSELVAQGLVTGLEVGESDPAPSNDGSQDGAAGSSDDENEDNGGEGDAGGDGSQSSPDPARPNGFPENTPIADMTLEEQVAYHKFQKRKTEAKLRQLQKQAPAQGSQVDVDAVRAEGLTQGLAEAARIDLARRANVDPSDAAFRAVVDLFPDSALVKDGKLDDSVLGQISTVLAGSGAQSNNVNRAFNNAGGGRQEGHKAHSIKASKQKEDARIEAAGKTNKE